MTTIWKFVVRADDYQTVRVPRGSKAIAAQVQRSEVCVWFVVDTDNADDGVEAPIMIHGTGHRMSPDAIEGRHIGTVQLLDGSLIFHVFVGKGF